MRIRVFYPDRILEGTVVSQYGDEDGLAGVQRGVIFDNRETDTVTEQDTFELIYPTE